MRVPQNCPGSVIRPCTSHLGRVGVVPRRAGGEQIVQPCAVEVGHTLAYIGRVCVRKVRRVVPGDVGVVSGQVGADQLAVHALEVVVGLAVGLLDNQVEVAGVHA